MKSMMKSIRSCSKFLGVISLCFSISFTLLSAQTQVGADLFAEASGDNFGAAVATSADGKRIAIGAPLNEGGGTGWDYDGGEVRILEEQNGNWVQIGNDIEGPNRGDQIGRFVSMSGDGKRVAIPNGNFSIPGFVSIYEEQNGNWVQIGNTVFGRNPVLSKDGKRLISADAGARINGVNFGLVKVFEEQNGSWVQIGNDFLGTTPGGYEGASISISEDGKRIAMSNHFDGQNGPTAGRVRVFEDQNGNWVQVGANILGESGTYFGQVFSLAAQGKRLIVPLRFRQRVEIYDEVNGSWVLSDTIKNTQPVANFGYAVSSSEDGKRITILDNGIDRTASTIGKIHVFDETACGWVEQSHSILASQWGIWLGTNESGSMEISNDGRRFIVGLPQNQTIGPSAGKAIILEFPAWTGQTAAAVAILDEQNCSGCGEIRLKICQNSPASDLDLEIQANTARDANTSLRWYTDNNGSQGAVLGATSTINTTNRGKRYYWVTQQRGSVCESPPRKVRLKVKRESVPVFANVPSQGCGGSSAQLNLAKYVSDPTKKATKFTFYAENPEYYPGATPIGSVSANKGTVKAGQNMIVTLDPLRPTYWVKATVPNGCGGVASTTISMSQTQPTINPIQNITFTAGDAVNIPMTGQNTTMILWNNHSSFNNPNIGIMGSAGMPPLMFTAQNNGSADLTAKIRVIPYGGNCAGTPLEFNITVKPASVPRQGPLNSLQVAGMQLAGGTVALDWQIVYDQELLRFEVEKEVGEDHWVKIGEVASHGNGSYGFTDHEAYSEVNRYRLHLVHADGRSIWSEVVTVASGHALNPQTDRFSVFPNPTEGRVTIRRQSASGNCQWQVSDMMGKVLQNGSMTEQEMSLDLNAFSGGMYQIILISPEGERFVNRVIRK